jgi:hypothetical protein
MSMKNNIDNDDFNKWLKSTAEDQGISEQQLLSEIISAYSIMHEMKTSAVSASNHQINSASDIEELKKSTRRC